MSAPDSPPVQARPPADSTARFAWGLLLGVLLLLMSILAGVLWLSFRSDLAERQEQLVADTLWVKQSIEFQLRRHGETLQSLAQAIEHDQLSEEALRTKTRTLLSANREIVAMSYIDARGQHIDLDGRHDSVVDGAILNLLRDASRTRQASYRRGSDGEWKSFLHFAVPVIGGSGGSLIVSYSMDGLLKELVPWWLARDSRVSFADAFGEPLATQGMVELQRAQLHHQTPIELPGETLVVMMDSTRGGPSAVPRIVTGAAVVLGLMLLLSLALLWRDMRQRAAAERALSEQLAYRKAMENSLVTGLRVRDTQGRVTYVNPAFCQMVGYTADELLGRGWPMPFYDMGKEDLLRERHEQMLAGTITAEGYETDFIRRDGARLHVLIHEAPLLDATGRQTGWMSSILDITGLKRAEDLNRQQQEKLQATARLVTMGEVATALSHELNQPLSAITSYATGCLNLVSEGQPLLRLALERVQEQADRAGHIIRSVHDFVRRRDAAKAMCDIGELVEAVMPLVQLQARKLRVRIETDIAPGLPRIPGDPTMLEQVLLNLTRNAIEAMAQQAAERRVLRIEARPHATGVEVGVVDHGSGIEPAAAEKLFTAFYTTKTEGMGIGLSICRTAVELHRGHLWFEHTPGGGATFRFTLQT